MTDFALTWDNESMTADLSVAGNDLAADEGLETSVMLSLFSDRRAEAGDPLPDGEQDRRGWWADAHPVVEGDRFGSRLWLLARSKATEDVRVRAEEYAREALQWLLDDRVSPRVDVAVEFMTAPKGLALEVKIYRPGKADPALFRFDRIWTAQESRA